MTIPARSFEDLHVGERRESREVTVAKEEMLEFARKYDPQWFHTDEDKAKASHFGGVVASGIYILALLRQLDHETNGDIDFVCGIGWDEVRIVYALRPGDRIRISSEILSLRPSQSTTDRGTAITRYEMTNQDGKPIIHFSSINLVYTRAAQARRAFENSVR